jgi:GNAT superfamily N-acetyltransferase
MNVRPADEADLPAIASILEANDEPVSWPDVPRPPYVEHLLTRPGLRLVVGELDGTVAGVAGSIEVGSPARRFLTDLYVDPGRQSRGLGSAMLREVMAVADERMTFSSRDPRALSAYIRSGMRPWWPLLYLEGEAARLGAHDRGVEERPADEDESARLSKAWTGIDRSVDFAFYARRARRAGPLARPRLDGARRRPHPGRLRDPAGSRRRRADRRGRTRSASGRRPAPRGGDADR